MRYFEQNEQLLEARRAKATEENVPVNPDASAAKVVVDDKQTTMSKAQIDNLKGKSPEQNGSDGAWAVDEPTDNKNVTEESLKDIGRNERRLLRKIRRDEPFFIQGRAGWGKTSVIKKVARSHGMTVVTVYLDKAEATDLGGIPVPLERTASNGSKFVSTYFAMPPWAAYIAMHEDKDFLLFFDEMNQAAPDVMNALMPIILERNICGHKFTNVSIGAAGNLLEENENGVNELPGPLRDRFGDPFIWETNTAASWTIAFDHLRNEKPTSYINRKESAYDGETTWTELLGKEFIDRVQKYAEMFRNPRAVERNIFNTAYADAHSAWHSEIESEDIQDAILGACLDDADNRYDSKKMKDAVNELTEYVTKYINNGGYNADAGEAKKTYKKRGTSMFSDSLVADVAEALKRGYVMLPDGQKLGISEENVGSLCGTNDGEPLTAEQVNLLFKLVRNSFRKEGEPLAKFKTNADFLKLKGFTDKAPSEEEYTKGIEAKK